MFCVCDASYWVYKLKFPKKYKIYSFSDLVKRRFQLINEAIPEGVWILYDDVSLEERRKVLKRLMIKDN